MKANLGAKHRAKRVLIASCTFHLIGPNLVSLSTTVFFVEEAYSLFGERLSRPGINWSYFQACVGTGDQGILCEPKYSPLKNPLFNQRLYKRHRAGVTPSQEYLIGRPIVWEVIPRGLIIYPTIYTRRELVS